MKILQREMWKLVGSDTRDVLWRIGDPEDVIRI